MADNTVEPSLWESGQPIGKDLTPKTPSTAIAGELGMKYGDTKTASVGGPGYELGAALKYKPQVGRADKHQSNISK